MQAATVASECMEDKEALANYFEKLYKETDDAYEEELLRSAIRDLRKNGCIGEKTNALYRKDPARFFPIFPFLEVCHLPTLFKPGDVIVCEYRDGPLYACVDGMPYLSTGACDFSDECYYCHDIDCICSKQKLEEGFAHYHIHLCSADPFNEDKLTAKQRKNLAHIREYIMEKQSQRGENT